MAVPRTNPDLQYWNAIALGLIGVLAALALWLTTRRLHTPTRNLPKGQRVA
jgi:hypothetical protein